MDTPTPKPNSPENQTMQRPAVHKPELNAPVDYIRPAAPRPAMPSAAQPQNMQAPNVPPQNMARPGVPQGTPRMMPQNFQRMAPQPRIQTPEEKMAAIKAEIIKSSDIPDPIPCEHLGFVNEEPFSDLYITPDRKCYTWAAKSDAGLKVVDFVDYAEFLYEMEKAYDGNDGNPSFLLTYKGRHFRVERTVSGDGPQFCARKMPTKVPNLDKLGLPIGLHKYLLSLAGRSGLILLAGPTGSGKSTTISSLLQEYLQQKGGYCFTVEDPIELPLDGVYLTPSGELGLCKQTTPPKGIWAEGIKSALRSKPRYIYLGEIRDPQVASEALRAATSGHLVFSTIHANNVSDAINSLVKYAASSGISEEMAYELVANGFLACIHQILTGAPKHVEVTYIFANPDLSAGCQVRSMFRNGKLNLSTIMEQQKIKIDKSMPLF